MADQKINELPTKTAPSTGDKMLMIGTAEEYQIDYDKLASAILDKLATKQYSELDTTAKTVLGAIDELNSNMFPNGIKNNIDYNDLPIGFHYCGTGCTNSPGDYYRVICLYSSNSDHDNIQVAYSVISNIMSIRTSVNANWKEWKTFSDDATLFAGTSISSGDDLNDYTTPGIYYSASQSVSSTLSNIPEVFQSGFAMLVLPMSANICQVIFAGGAGGNMYTRSTITSGFQKWYKFEGTLISS